MSSLSWRLSVVENDKSQRTLVSSSDGVGGTVVAAPRSLETPVLFAEGETQRILNLLGVPTMAEQGLLEAIEYNKSYPLWIVSPAKILKKPYMRLTSTIIAEADDYMMGEIDEAGTYPAGKDFTLNANGDVYEASVTVNGVENLTTSEFSIVCDSNPEGNITLDWTNNVIEGDVTGSITRSGANATFTLDIVGTDYENKTFHVAYTQRCASEDVAYLVQKNVGNYLTASISSKGSGTIVYSRCELKAKNYLGNTKTLEKIDFALVDDAKDGFGNNINVVEAFSDSDFVEAYYNPKFGSLSEEIVYASESHAFKGVERPADLTGVDITGGYAFFKKANTYPVDLLFDATGSSDALSSMVEIRGEVGTGYQPFARILAPLSKCNKASEVLEAMNNVASNKGLSVYCGRFKISNAYSSRYSVIEGVPMGEVAKRHADAITLSYGGLATAWIDENGVGGQLTGGRILGLAKNQEEFTETELQSIDEAKCNAIVYDYTYGPMITSRRTTYSDYSDYSFNDYSGIVDYCLKNITKKVCPYQYVKLNDEEHRSLVKSRCISILDPLTAAPYNVLDSYAVKCDEENNNDEVKANEEFVLEVAIKVTAKSRTIKLIFTNTPQTSTVESILE